MSVTLTYGTETVTLRNPDFGNTESVESRRIFRKTRGLDMILFRDPVWSRTNITKYSFSFLKRNDLLRLVAFLDRSLGQNITLVDHTGIEWVGLILTPGANLIQAARQNFAVELEFQGVRT